MFKTHQMRGHLYAYDAKLDIVYVPTGVGTPDIWGGNRTKLHERYANSMLALNATTGKLIWNFQTTHHDLWDMDVPSQPSLADIKDKDGNIVPAIYVLTKTGNAFVLDRRNGKAIVPITEKPVPQTVKRGLQTKGRVLFLKRNHSLTLIWRLKTN